MSLVMILITLIVIGFLMGVINRYIPMADSVKSILNGLVVILILLWLLQVFGVIHVSYFDSLRMH
jgi:hypothetical protein